MKNLFVIISTVFLVACSGYFVPHNLDSEMSRLNVDTALVVGSNAIDEHPLWSPDSNYIAVNIMGKWKKVNLSNINLTKVKWRQGYIGALLNREDFTEELSMEEKNDFDKGLKFGARELLTKNKTKIKLELNGFSTSLSLEKKGEKPFKIWSSSMENCHSISLSPDEKYFAYLCEMNGLFVAKLF